MDVSRLIVSAAIEIGPVLPSLIAIPAALSSFIDIPLFASNEMLLDAAISANPDVELFPCSSTSKFEEFVTPELELVSNEK